MYLFYALKVKAARCIEQLPLAHERKLD
jgi:hypothetical protein